jgi:hypothetical protein
LVVEVVTVVVETLGRPGVILGIVGARVAGIARNIRVGGVATRRVCVVRGQEVLCGRSEVGRVGVGDASEIGSQMAGAAHLRRSTVDRAVRDPVVLTKPGTVAFAPVGRHDPVLGAAVAARASDRVEAGATTGGAYVDLSTAGVHAEVAGTAVAIQHVGAMDDVESVWPGLPFAERNIGGVEFAVAVGAEVDVVCFIRVVLVRRGVAGPEGYAQCGRHPDRGSTATS